MYGIYRKYPSKSFGDLEKKICEKKTLLHLLGALLVVSSDQFVILRNLRDSKIYQ